MVKLSFRRQPEQINKDIAKFVKEQFKELAKRNLALPVKIVEL